MTTVSSPHSLLAFSPTQITEKLQALQREQVLTDSTILLHGDVFHFHSSIVSLFSEVLRSKLFTSSTIDDFDQVLSFLPDSSLFFKVLETLYGIPLPVTQETHSFLFIIANILKYTPLINFISSLLQSGLSATTAATFQLKHELLVKKLKSEGSNDVTISFNESTVRISSILLAALSTTFNNQFTGQFMDSNDRKFSYNHEFPGLEEQNFTDFFNLFFAHEIQLNISNVLSFYQLGFYFQVLQITESCKHFLLENDFTDEDLLYLLNTTNERNQFGFLEKFLNIYDNFAKPLKMEAISLSIHFILVLFPVVDNWWLLCCLLETFKKIKFSAEELKSVLKLVNVEQFNLSQLYSLIEPVFSEKSFELELLLWSLQLFENIQNLSQIPPRWFVWSFQAADRNNFKLEFFTESFKTVVPFSVLSSFTPF
ncbi:hypothetical protein GEMRC1_013332 [Eukaryota sp. GEM-RC1]